MKPTLVIIDDYMARDSWWPTTTYSNVYEGGTYEHQFPTAISLGGPPKPGPQTVLRERKKTLISLANHGRKRAWPR